LGSAPYVITYGRHVTQTSDVEARHDFSKKMTKNDVVHIPDSVFPGTETPVEKKQQNRVSVYYGKITFFSYTNAHSVVHKAT